MTALLTSDTDLRDRARHEGLIGIGVHGLHRPPGMSALRGEAAMLQLDRDHKKFGQGHTARRTKEVRKGLEAFRRVVDAALALDPNAVLANRIDGSYDRRLRADGFRLVERPEYLQMVHRVFLPYLPGGYRQVHLRIEVADAGLRFWVETYLEYFDGDTAGREATLNESQDESTKAPLDAYIREALLDPELVQAALEPPKYEDSPNAWKNLNARDLKLILDSNPTLTAFGIDDPLRPGFDESRAQMFAPDTRNLVNYCVAFLSAFTPAKKPTWGTGSLAEVAAVWGGDHTYRMPHGALIAAAIHLGLTSEKEYWHSLNVGISRGEIQWVSEQGGNGPVQGRKPRDWDIFLGRKHLFA